jgi:hemoglobin
MLRTGSTLTVALLLWLCVSAGQAEDSLYKRLGGYDAIAAVTDAFIVKLEADPAFARFFTGHSNFSHRRQRQLVVDFVCEATGGPCFYIGRDLKTAHAGLEISEELWGKFGAHFDATLTEFGVSDDLKSELFALLGGVQGDIVETR